MVGDFGALPGQYGIRVAKFADDDSRNPIWAVGGGNSDFHSIAIDSAGNSYVSGFYLGAEALYLPVTNTPCGIYTDGHIFCLPVTPTNVFFFSLPQVSE